LKEKKNLFDIFCQTKAQEEIQKRKEKTPLIKQAYFELLKKHINVKTKWQEFSKRYKRQPSFMAVEVRERENWFNEYKKLHF
jgi:hypothetical protein